MPRVKSDSTSALLPPVNTSHRPISNRGVPEKQAAISNRSSATDTCQRRESNRHKSRSRVVFPAPGGATISVLSNPLLHRAGSSPSAIPIACFAIRRFSEDKARIFLIRPLSSTASPQIPKRCPYFVVTNPSRSCPSTVCTECSAARASNNCSSSDVAHAGRVTCSPATTAVIGRSNLSRNSSHSGRCASDRVYATRQRRSGSKLAAV